MQEQKKVMAGSKAHMVCRNLYVVGCDLLGNIPYHTYNNKLGKLSRLSAGK